MAAWAFPFPRKLEQNSRALSEIMDPQGQAKICGSQEQLGELTLYNPHRNKCLIAQLFTLVELVWILKNKILLKKQCDIVSIKRIGVLIGV